MRKLAVKYCGSCNPQVDLSRLGAELAGMATELGATIVPLEQGDIDLVVILCGCPRACGNKRETTAMARRAFLVSGRDVSVLPVSVISLPADAMLEELTERLGLVINGLLMEYKKGEAW